MTGSISASAGKNSSIGGISFSQNRTTTGSITKGTKKALALGKAGTLTTRTDADTGTLTMGTGHGIITGDIIDIYWTNSDGTIGVQYAVTVGTVSGTSVPFDSGTGQNLPIATTAIIACVVTNIALELEGDDILQLAFTAAGIATVTFLETATPAFSVSVDAACVWQWVFGESTIANPLAGASITNIALSTGVSAGASSILTSLAALF